MGEEGREESSKIACTKKILEAGMSTICPETNKQTKAIRAVVKGRRGCCMVHVLKLGEFS
jgi:hypothetical protein